MWAKYYLYDLRCVKRKKKNPDNQKLIFLCLFSCGQSMHAGAACSLIFS